MDHVLRFLEFNFELLGIITFCILCRAVFRVAVKSIKEKRNNGHRG